MRTGIVAVSLLAATTLALAQTPPPGGGGGGGGGGNQPTITWTYSGTKTIFNGHRTDTFSVQSASDLSATLASFSPKVVKIEATVKVIVEWPAGATVPEYQWFKLNLKSSSLINSGYAGTVIADNGWTDASTGLSGRTALSEGKHLIRRKVENRKVELEYDLVGEASGTHPATGMASVQLQMGIELTDRKVTLNPVDCVNWSVSDDGTKYIGYTVFSSFPIGISPFNNRTLNVAVLGAWNWSPAAPLIIPGYGVLLQTETTQLNSFVPENLSFDLTNEGAVQDISAMYGPIYGNNHNFKFKAKDKIDGYDFTAEWEWKLRYALEDWDEDFVDERFLLNSVLPIATYSPGTNQASFTFENSFEVSQSLSTSLTVNVEFTANLIQDSAITASLGQTTEVSRTWTQGQTVSVSIPAGGAGFYQLGIGLPHYWHYGSGTTWKKNGEKLINQLVVWKPAPTNVSFGLMAIRTQSIQGKSLPYDDSVSYFQ